MEEGEEPAAEQLSLDPFLGMVEKGRLHPPCRTGKQNFRRLCDRHALLTPIATGSPLHGTRSKKILGVSLIGPNRILGFFSERNQGTYIFCPMEKCRRNRF